MLLKFLFQPSMPALVADYETMMRDDIMHALDKGFGSMY